MSTKKISWRTETRLVQNLIPYEKNPRKITEDQAKQLQKSFKKFNYVDYEHSCQKPLQLHEKPLLRCTKVGDNVLDLCGGSGSTLLACEQMKRVAFIAEKEAVYCQLIIDRYESFTGNKAIKVA